MGETDRGATRRRRARSLLALILFGALASSAVVALPASASLPATATTLPGVMSAMVVDSATNHVFVSLPAAGKVAVLDFDGKLVGTIAGEADARGLAVDANHLYVVRTAAGAIDEIDTGTLTKTRTLASGLTGIREVAVAAGALWVVNGSWDLVKVSMVDGSTTPYASVVGSHRSGLATDPSDPDVLVAYAPGLSPVSMTRVDLSTDPPTAAVSKSITAPIVSNVRDVAVSPDGTHVVPAGGAPYEFVELDMADLTASGDVYDANPYPSAIAMTGAGGGLLAGGMDGATGNDVVVYDLGDPSAPVAAHDFGSSSQTVEPGGLAFSPNGARLFAVTGDGGSQAANDTFRVLTLSGPQPPAKKVALSRGTWAFGAQRVSTFGRAVTINVTNTGTLPVTLRRVVFGGANSYDFFGTTNCFATGSPRVLAVGAHCRAVVYFAPIKVGTRTAKLLVYDNTTSSPHQVKLSGGGTEGYFLAGAHGQIANFGDAVFHGDVTHVALNAPVVSVATTSNGAGYWLLARDGGIFTFGNAKFRGSTGGMRLNQPVVGMATTRGGSGYWLVASDGGIFAFGDATFHGSTGAMRLNQPIVGMTVTPTRRGYWLVASDGGIFAFGDAKFRGSTGGMHLARPIVAMVATPSGNGYWLVASDGGIFAFGDAKFYGSAAATGRRIVAMAATPTGRGYWMVSDTGWVFAYGDAPHYGDLRTITTHDAIGIAGTAPPLPPELLRFTTSRASAFAASAAPIERELPVERTGIGGDVDRVLLQG